VNKIRARLSSSICRDCCASPEPKRFHATSRDIDNADRFIADEEFGGKRKRRIFPNARHERSSIGAKNNNETPISETETLLPNIQAKKNAV
jgi:hypothetical protein